MSKQLTSTVFLTLGSIWLIVGLFIYPESAVWPIGVVFLITGLIMKIGSATR